MAAEPASAWVTLQNVNYTLDDIKAKNTDIPEGNFICLLHEQHKDKKEALIEAFKAAHGFENTMVVNFPMFSGKMSKAGIMWLLEKDEVKCVEQDGVTSIA
mmetsp:Transcript_98217/g.278313  ORF Transcript_98217/g.278313 Transcript_98217/m.278313 type:complete len:101 (-) Transcript_98217:74-376(-)